MICATQDNISVHSYIRERKHFAHHSFKHKHTTLEISTAKCILNIQCLNVLYLVSHFQMGEIWGLGKSNM